MRIDVSELAGISAAELAAVSHLLRAAYSEALRVQCGWEGQLSQVSDLARAYAAAAKELARQETADREGGAL